MKKILGQLLAIIVFVFPSFAQENLVSYTFFVDGTCGMCKERIETIAVEKGEATSAEWDLQTKMLTIEIDEENTTVMGVKWELAQAGHDSKGFKAPDDVYENLHFCCRYRPETFNNESEIIEENLEHNTSESNSEINSFSGYIYGVDGNKKYPLVGATVTIKNTAIGTSTNFDGFFHLENKSLNKNELEISYIGYEDKLIVVDQEGELEILLDEGHQLDIVEIKYKKRTTEVSFVKTLNVETVTREELCKAACCNLSESFETNPSVDVSFNDAVTGTRQIQMLGLAGPNVQMSRELIPDIRAMSSVYGLAMTPGPWIESIQLIKGVGSVVNGFESITGQINVELKKPEAGEQFFLNGYINQASRVELNANTRFDLSENISSGILIHGKRMSEVHDNNNDGFTDMPREQDFILSNRWKFKQKGNFQGQFGIKYSSFSHEAGYHDHFSEAAVDHENHWQMYNDTDRLELWGKIGYVNPDAPENSVGLQLSYVDQDQIQEFGFSNYNTNQKSIYSNLIYQYLKNNHTIRAGFSYQYDEIDEFIDRSGYYGRRESVPGGFFEYTYSKDQKLSIIPGVRLDHHNNYGWIFVPRLHAKYNISDKQVIRLVGGKGWRTANVFAEQLGVFSSSRSIFLEQENLNNPYGLDAEIAWNYGINYTHGFNIAGKEALLMIDFYRTDFVNQIVVDYETPTEFRLYNLNGQSYSNSFQVKLEYELFRNLDVRLAYRLFDVKTDYESGLKSKPLLAKDRAFINMAYKTKSNWHFDATLNWNGSKRLPFTGSNPEPYQRADRSPDFFILNAQIMKRWGDKWDVYLGGENLLNFRQENAIVASDDAFGPYFDGSMIWAPIFGTNIYLGFRMTIKE